MGRQRKSIKAVQISSSIVNALINQDGARVTEVADEVEVAPSTAYNHLQTLVTEGFVISEGNEFYPSLAFLEVAEYTRNRKFAYRKAHKRVRSLADETGGRSHFAVEEQGRGRYMYTSTGDLALDTVVRPGTGFPLHVAAAGKALLAHLREERIYEIIEQYGLEQKTENSITTEEELFDELETVRNRGVAFNVEEQNPGISATATAVRDENGQVIGALSVSGPAQRFKGDKLREEIPDLLLATANELELDIEYSQ